MRTIQSTITSKGQSTIPAEIRKRLGVDVRNRIEWVIEGDTIQVRSPAHTLESVLGSVKPNPEIEDIDAAIRRAKEAKAARTVSALRDAR